MMQLIYGEDIGLLETKILEITKNNYSKLMLDKDFSQIQLSICQPSFFEDKQANCFVIYDNEKILASKKETNFKEVISYLKELKNCESKIIFVLNNNEVNKNYAPYFELINIKKLNRLTIKTYCKNLIDKYKIKMDQKTLDYLISKLPTDSLTINNEIKKLSLVDDVLTMQNIDEIISFDINNNIFDLINYFFDDNKIKIVEHLQQLEAIKIDFFEIFNVLVSQLFTLKLYCLHYQKNRNFNQLMNDFKIQYFQLEKYKKTIQNVDVLQINRFLNNLLELNISFFTGTKLINLCLKMILLNGKEYGI
ncbi:MAG: hypothetical protein HUJ42_00685 [Malacoplasma sp.]|nr:hypothetical protein [Malacoplasma sp.]